MIPPAPPGAVRFNPPPQWTAPAGFDPRRGHLPDPTWPPAPSDWEFWVPDAAAGRYPTELPSATLPQEPGDGGGASAGRERRRGVLAVVGALALVGVIFWISSLSSPVPTGVGSCWSGVEGGQMDPVRCDSSQATHQIESRVSDLAECPMTSNGYFEDGNGYFCVRRLG